MNKTTFVWQGYIYFQTSALYNRACFCFPSAKHPRTKEIVTNSCKLEHYSYFRVQNY